MNACLLCRPGEERITLERWLKEHNVKYSDDMKTEELRQLYIRKEQGYE